MIPILKEIGLTAVDFEDEMPRKQTIAKDRIISYARYRVYSSYSEHSL
jgi:hypothetical protein